MDDIDATILRELQRDGRMSMAALGSIVGVAPSTVYKRIEKLKSAGIIERFTIAINPSCFEQTLTAFLNIRVDPDGKPEDREFMRNHPDIRGVRGSGAGDFFAKVRVRNITGF